MTRPDLESKLRVAAAGLGLDPLLDGVALRLSDVSETAAWVYDQLLGRVEIHVHPDVCARLAGPELRVLLLHELYHHIGYSELHRLRGLGCAPAVSLALDVAVDAILASGVHRDTLVALADGLLLADAPADGPLPQGVSLALLHHPRPPLDRMSPDHALAWLDLWTRPLPPIPERCYQRLRPFFGPGGESEDSKGPATSPELAGTVRPGAIELERASGKCREPRPGERILVRALPPGAAPAELSAGMASRLGGQLPGSATWLNRSLVAPAQEKPGAGRLRGWLLRQAERARAVAAARAVTRTLTPARSLPYLVRPTRAELLRQMIGWPSFRYMNRGGEERSVLPVYVDVSGSMSSELPRVLAVLRALRELLPQRLYLFDTAVRPVPASRALKAGVFDGGGTDFDAVFEHALRNRTRDIVVLTDGASCVTGEVLERARRAGLRARAVLFGHAAAAAQQEWWSGVFGWG